jgi:diguanylate cyclase (GGDEF)-like protein
VAADGGTVNQLRLFPRAERLPVLVLDDGGGDAVALLRRLHRSRRLDAVPAPSRAVGMPAAPGGGAAAHEPAAIVVATDAHPASVAELRRLVARAGRTPVVAVAQGGREAVLAVLEAGAEEVVEADRATTPAMERAVLAAVTRRVADRRSGAGTSGDALTGLATRARLDAELPGLLDEVARGGSPVAVLYCDLDRLKVVNDSLGHGVGDAVLVEAADRLRGAVRSSDWVVRVGGDEFVVVLRGPQAAAVADDVARRIVEGFSVPVEVGDHRLAVGVSVGLAVARPGESAAELLERADRALYLAKRRGRGRVARAEARTTVEGHEHLGDVLRDALVRDRLEPEQHPVLDPDGRLVGHRVVPVWAPAAGGRVPPVGPGDAAEDAGLAPDLFAWTLRHLPAAGAGVRLGPSPARCYVDLPRSVLAGSPTRRLESAPAGLEALERLVVLVDERHLLDPDAVRSSLLELARAGVRVGVARFGAVHASLGVLERHPFDSVWLDRDAVDGLATCALRRARLRAVLEVADALGQLVVAPAPALPDDRAALAEVGPVAVEQPSLDLRTTVVPSRPPVTAPDRVG